MGLSVYNTESLTWAIMVNLYGECHATCRLKTSFVYFGKE
jgi:hypothetical protein